MIAFDTNILIYSCDQSEIHRQSIALELVQNTRDGVLLWQAVCEFIGASRKLVDKGFTRAHAWARVSELLHLFPLVVPNHHVLDRARQLHVEQHWSFWDAMMVGACLDAGVTRLYSEDPPVERRRNRWKSSIRLCEFGFTVVFARGHAIRRRTIVRHRPTHN